MASSDQNRPNVKDGLNEEELRPGSLGNDVRRALSRKLAIGSGIATIVVGLASVIGPSIGPDLIALETWIEAQGAWGPVYFACLVVILTSIFVPDTLLAAAAGAMFGIVVGAVVMVVGSIATQSVAFGISRHFLSDRVRHALEQRPSLVAIERAADRQGIRLQLLLRLMPLNPAVVSYVLGVTRVGFPVFLIGCLGLVPGMTVEVYFGYAAKHMFKVAGNVSHHSTTHTVITISGLVICVLVMMCVTHTARKALAESEQPESSTS